MRTGFSLIEILIATVIVALVLHGVGTAILSGQAAHQTLIVKSNIQDSTERALNIIESDLINSDNSFSSFETEDHFIAAYRVCTSLKADGEPVMNGGEYGREIIYDKLNKTLSIKKIDDTGYDYDLTVCDSVIDFSMNRDENGYITVEIEVQKSTVRDSVVTYKAARIVLPRNRK